MIFSEAWVYAWEGLTFQEIQMTKASNQTTSKDGTSIAFDQTGQGPPVILVLGAFNDRTAGAALAAYLAARFTVFNYDRRGRGASGDGVAYAVEREIEDLDALIRVAGGSASVFGYSSGAALALQAAVAGLSIPRLALYELPPVSSEDHAGALAQLIQAGRRGDAVEYFQRDMVGIPAPVVVGLRQAPFRPALEAMAHTLVYEATILHDPLSPAQLAQVNTATLAIAGGASPPSMRQIAEGLGRSLPNGRSVILDGATHDIVPAQVGPVLEGFFT
jgi:pimeloyl-ACP methyl ester carboxylesterase